MGTELSKDFLNGVLNKSENIVDHHVSSDFLRGIAEEYLNGRLNIHVHIRFDTEEYCAICDRDREIFSLDGLAVFPRERDSLSKVASREQEVAMLIRVTKSVEIPEIISTRTLARLKRIDDGDYCVGDPLELTKLLCLIFRGVNEDGEFIPISRLVTSRKNQLPNKMVERTPEVIQHFSDAQTQVFGHGRYVNEAVECISRIRFELFCDTIRFGITQGYQLHAQSLTLFSGPGKFNVGTFEGGHNDTLQKDSGNSKRTRNSHSHKGRVRTQPQKGSEAEQVNAPKSEEVESQTSSDLHLGDCISKHIHSGSLEDV